MAVTASAVHFMNPPPDPMVPTLWTGQSSFPGNVEVCAALFWQVEESARGTAPHVLV